MRVALPSFLLCCLLITPDDAANPPPKMYEQKLLQSNLYIRLLKKSWKPVGPSADTDEVMEEYQWGVDVAFKALLKSSWEYESVPLQEVEKLFESDNYNKDHETIVIIHPILASADVIFTKTTINALAMRNLHKQYNIFAIDMPWNNPQMIFSILKTTFGRHTYFETKAKLGTEFPVNSVNGRYLKRKEIHLLGYSCSGNLVGHARYPMAEAVSEFLVVGVDKKYLKPEEIHLLGWSYSGQLVGYIARYVEAKYETKIASIVSLDPHANFWNEELIAVSADDARVVHVFHSNSYVAGTRDRLGTADFVFNGGNIQPECELPHVLHATIKEPNACSHIRVVQRFWYVILYPSKFFGRRCPTWNRLKNCFCEENSLETISYPITNSQAKGTYFLRTLSVKPYGLGKWGVSCSSKKRLLMELNKEKKPET